MTCDQHTRHEADSCFRSLVNKCVVIVCTVDGGGIAKSALARPLRAAQRKCREAEVVASDDEQVQVPAYGGQRLGADAAQLTSGSLIGHGTDLLGHGERDLP